MNLVVYILKIFYLAETAAVLNLRKKIVRFESSVLPSVWKVGWEGHGSLHRAC